MRESFFSKVIHRGQIKPVILCFTLLVGCLLFNSSVKAQKIEDTYISLDLNNSTLRNALRQIESKTSFLISFKSKDIDAAKTISFRSNNISVEAALKQILQGTDLTFVQINKNIVIKRENESIEEVTGETQLSAPTENVSRMIRGLVVNQENREPIAGASIEVLGGDKAGLISNENGTFSFSLPENATSFVVSCVGYERQTVSITNGNFYSVSLTPRSSMLSDVVITGYSKVDKRLSASSVGTIKGDELERKDFMSVDQMIQGKVSGLNVNLTSTTPGAAPKLRLRGTSTLLGSREPIWVVDGFVVDAPVKLSAQDINSLDNENILTSPIAGVNPNDIERIDVLKDASATAIYGVKGANGVIVITTKQGKFNQKLGVNYSSAVTLLEAPTYKNLPVMNSQQRIDVSKEIISRGLNYPVAQARIGFEGAYQDYTDRLIDFAEYERRVKYFETINTDWMGILFRPAFSQSHTINFNAGGTNSTFFASLGYADQNSSALFNNQKRYTGLFKFNSRLNKDLTLGLRMGGSVNTVETPLNTNLYKYAYNTSRALEFERDGELVYYINDYVSASNSSENLAAGYNVMNELNNSRSNSRNLGMDISANLEWKFLRKFRFTGNYGYIVTQANRTNYATEETYYVSDTYRYNINPGLEIPESLKQFVVMPRGGEYRESNTLRNSYTIRNSVDYTSTIGEHFFSALIGNELRSTNYNATNSFRLGYLPDRGLVFYTPDINEYPLYYTRLSQGSYPPITILDKVERYLSWYGIFSYSFKNRYVLNLNIRNDGSNKFGTAVNNKLLPTFSSAFRWIISDEKWFDKSKNLNLLSLRLSYGFNGNIPETESPQLIITQPSINNFTGQDNSFVATYPNPNLRWEKTSTVNAGLEFSLFENRLTGVGEFYYKKGTDLISVLDVPASNGITRLAINGANIVNKGYELTLNYTIIKNKNWLWRTGVLFGRNYSKILKSAFAEPNPVLVSQDGGYYSGINSYLFGNATSSDVDPNTLYAYKFQGLNDAGRPTFYKIFNTDYSGKPIVSDYFNTILAPMGSRIPKFDGSFYSNVKYKNWLLNAAFIVKIGYVQRLPFVYGSSSNMIPSVNDNLSSELVNRWRQPGDELLTNIPGLTDVSGFISSSTVPYTISSTIWQLYNFSDIRVVNASHVRLSSLALSYNWVPNAQLRKIFNSINVRLQGNDLFVFAAKEWKGRDPETLPSSLGRLPSYSLSFNISF